MILLNPERSWSSNVGSCRWHVIASCIMGQIRDSQHSSRCAYSQVPTMTALPKSKSSRLPPNPNHAPPSAHHQAESALNAASNNPNFNHPDHVIPRPDYSRFQDLIIVCCHAIYLPDADAHDFPLYSPHDQSNWVLAPFQNANPETGKPGEHTTFLAHATAGLRALTISPDNTDLEKNLLILSGGATKPDMTSMTEARSYYHALLADELLSGHHGGGPTHALYTRGRILLEQHATDSLQNLLFSILLFRQTVGRYPRHVRLITHAFKARRVLQLHAAAIKWPKNRILVQGIDPIMSSQELQSAIDGEETSGYTPWEADPLGSGQELSHKRKQRGWDGSVVDALTHGLEACVKELVQGRVVGRLPWENDDNEHIPH
ncbi:hypothetical protein BDU57DRAFT_524760 [Ampelomyces quisqualis]|uniref:DUF218 domain-containing protein n=1 Tax=Ampelomyces quisqualis TaxID=50730 RepID=A0A6A5Q9R2_AMPQU|nr:hypothetical protein BDU57DRAFT_524760 [Ampelomyces quisqualis]